MVAAAVSRLRLRAPPRLRGKAVQQVEDALRLAPGEDGRLLVLRRLALGRQPLGRHAAPLVETAAAHLRTAGAGAVHGGAPGAEAAAAVWFASADEARGILILRLAAGERPAEWFWRLAVPDWRGRDLAEWLPGLFAEAARDGRLERALARAVLGAAREGTLTRLVTAIGRAPLPQPPAAPPARHETPGPAAPTARDKTRARGLPADSGTTARLTALLAPVGRDVRVAFRNALAAAPRDGPLRPWLARLFLLAVQPALAGEQPLLAQLAEAFAGSDDTAPAPPAEAQARPILDARVREVMPPHAAPVAPKLATASQAEASAPATIHTPEEEPPAAADLGAIFPGEAFSPAAGLLLVINPLKQIDFPRWLQHHSLPGPGGFGPALLGHIATRMRVPAEDPAVRCLDPPMAEDGWEDALTLWRVGLDRWLRRRVRRRLADLVHRRGWIAWTDERISVRYPLGHADLRLRRHALDVDPGWTPWLGRVVVYHFSDEPLP